MFKVNRKLIVEAEMDATDIEQGNAVLLSHGLTAGELMKTIYHNMAVTKKIPFVDDGERPYNQETIDAMIEAREAKEGSARFTSAKDMFEAMDKE